MTTNSDGLLTPDKILNDFKNGKIIEKEAISFLKTLIEKSNESSIRIRSLNLLGRFNINDDNTFKMLESYLVSDDDHSVREAAVKLIYKTFPSKSLEPLKWVIENDESPLAIKTVLNLLDNTENPQATLLKEEFLKFLSNLYGVIEREVPFLLDYQIIFGKRRSTLTKKEYTLPYRHPSHYKPYFFDLYSFYDYLVLNQRIVGLKIPGYDCEGIEKALELFLETLPSLTKLKYLSLFDVNSIPRSLTSLNRLKGLKLNGTKRLTLPNDITKLKKLNELYVRRVFLKRISESLLALIKQNIAPKYIKRGVHPEDAMTLSLLDIYHSRELVEGVYQWSDLSYELNKEGYVIHLKKDLDDDATSIPKFIYSLTHLEKLEIWHGLIMSIPHVIKKLKHLKYLSLGMCPIRYISNSIGSLTSLETLLLSGAKFNKFPEAITKLTQLKELDLGESKIPTPIIRAKTAHLKNLKKCYKSI